MNLQMKKYRSQRIIIWNDKIKRNQVETNSPYMSNLNKIKYLLRLCMDSLLRWWPKKKIDIFGKNYLTLTSIPLSLEFCNGLCLCSGVNQLFLIPCSGVWHSFHLR